jgi:hypothetical protein
MYRYWIVRRRAASQGAAGPEKATASRWKAAAALFLAAAATFVIASNVSAEDDQMKVEGGWAYTARNKDGAVEHVAITRAAEDATWLVLTCSAGERLSVALIHVEQFPFPLTFSSVVKLRSNTASTVSIEGKSLQNNQIFVDPRPLRHIMPLLLQGDQLVVSISERDGAVHDYTFSIQPNDVALRAIRSHCFGF